MALPPDGYERVEPEWSDLTLGELIRHIRVERRALGARHSQGHVARALEISQATVGAIERGNRVPGLDILARLVTLLEPDEEAQTELLTRCLAKWVQRKAATVDGALAEGPLLQRAADALVGALAASHRALPPLWPRSLQGFPEQFQPLIGVFPDRREVPPESPADLFIRSGAVTDFQYLPLLAGLGEPLKVCSDKFFVVMPEEWRQERFAGHHLLVVGSSGVNWLTRQLAASALFRPRVQAAWRAWDADYRATSELDDDNLLGPFWRLVEQAQYLDTKKIDPRAIAPKVLGPAQLKRLPRAAELATRILRGETESSIVQHFRVPGFCDPADGEVHGSLPGTNTDFGVISLAPHPFDPTGRFVAIVCAGISGPGTAYGLKALFTNQDLFDEHPFGGVIKVSLPAREHWPGKFEKADWRWQTEPYRPETIERNLRQALATAPKDRRPAFEDWSEEELDAAIAFVGQLTTPPGQAP